MRTSLCVIWLNGAFRVRTDPFRIPYGLTKKKERKVFAILIQIFGGQIFLKMLENFLLKIMDLLLIVPVEFLIRSLISPPQKKYPYLCLGAIFLFPFFFWAKETEVLSRENNRRDNRWRRIHNNHKIITTRESQKTVFFFFSIFFFCVAVENGDHRSVFLTSCSNGRSRRTSISGNLIVPLRRPGRGDWFASREETETCNLNTIASGFSCASLIILVLILVVVILVVVDDDEVCVSNA